MRPNFLLSIKSFIHRLIFFGCKWSLHSWPAHREKSHWSVDSDRTKVHNNAQRLVVSTLCCTVHRLHWYSHQTLSPNQRSLAMHSYVCEWSGKVVWPDTTQSCTVRHAARCGVMGWGGGGGVTGRERSGGWGRERDHVIGKSIRTCPFGFSSYLATEHYFSGFVGLGHLSLCSYLEKECWNRHQAHGWGKAIPVQLCLNVSTSFQLVCCISPSAVYDYCCTKEINYLIAFDGRCL